MLNFLAAYCHEQDVEKIYRSTYNHETITSVMEKLGFEELDEVKIVYEKNYEETCFKKALGVYCIIPRAR
jgi:hypothetical protein